MSERRRKVFTGGSNKAERTENLKSVVRLVMPHMQKAITAGDWAKVEEYADQIMITAQNIQDEAA